MTVYLIHIHPPYKHAAHYVGFTPTEKSFRQRMKDHLFGNGSRLCAAASDAGCALQIAYVWPDGDRRFERYLKDRRDYAKWCPLCKGKRPIPQAMPEGYRTSTERRFNAGT